MSEPYIGEIRAFSFSWPPQGWIACNGQQVSIYQAQALYAVIAWRYGGDQKTYFNVPDLRGRAAMGAGNGPGLSSRALASTGGTETVALTAAQMAPHQHSVSALFTTNAANLTNTPSTTVVPSRTFNQRNYSNMDVNPWQTALGLDPSTIGPSTGSAPATQAHQNMQPWMVTNWCIASDGIFPVHSN